MIAAIKDGGCVRGMLNGPCEPEVRQDKFAEHLFAAPADLPDIHPNIAGIYGRKAVRLAEALKHPEDRDRAATAIRGLIERVAVPRRRNEAGAKTPRKLPDPYPTGSRDCTLQ